MEFRFRESSDLASTANRLEAVLRLTAKGMLDNRISQEVFMSEITRIRKLSADLNQAIAVLDEWTNGKCGYEASVAPAKADRPDIPITGNALESFDNLSKMKARLGEEGFVNKLVSEMTKWPNLSKDLISLMAWNDHNSAWYLNQKEIAERMTIDDEPITPERVAESLSSMVE